MADSMADGRTRVWWVSAIAVMASPTAAELNAGFGMQDKITPDGFIGFEAATAPVDNSALNSTVDTNEMGRDSYNGPRLRFKRQTTSDLPFTQLTRGTYGFVVVRRDLDETTAWLAGQSPVEVYAARCGRRSRMAPERNSVAKFEVPLFFHIAPVPDATVV